jgi:hypothetical protein
MGLVVVERGGNAMLMMRLVSPAIPTSWERSNTNRSQAPSLSIGRALTIIHANTDLLSSSHFPVPRAHILFLLDSPCLVY